MFTQNLSYSISYNKISLQSLEIFKAIFYLFLLVQIKCLEAYMTKTFLKVFYVRPQLSCQNQKRQTRTFVIRKLKIALVPTYVGKVTAKPVFISYKVNQYYWQDWDCSKIGLDNKGLGNFFLCSATTLFKETMFIYNWYSGLRFR